MLAINIVTLHKHCKTFSCPSAATEGYELALDLVQVCWHSGLWPFLARLRWPPPWQLAPTTPTRRPTRSACSCGWPPLCWRMPWRWPRRASWPATSLQTKGWGALPCSSGEIGVSYLTQSCGQRTRRSEQQDLQLTPSSWFLVQQALPNELWCVSEVAGALHLDRFCLLSDWSDDSCKSLQGGQH